MIEPDLNPQEPGVAPGADLSKLEALAAGTVGDLAEALEVLDGAELELLATLERQGKNRTTALNAIQREIEAREIPGEPEPAVSDKTPLGDATSYARMRAVEVDPAGLERPVLTLDGWVLPLPQAKGEG